MTRYRTPLSVSGLLVCCALLTATREGSTVPPLLAHGEASRSSIPLTAGTGEHLVTVTLALELAAEGEPYGKGGRGELSLGWVSQEDVGFVSSARLEDCHTEEEIKPESAAGFSAHFALDDRLSACEFGQPCEIALCALLDSDTISENGTFDVLVEAMIYPVSASDEATVPHASIDITIEVQHRQPG